MGFADLVGCVDFLCTFCLFVLVVFVCFVICVCIVFNYFVWTRFAAVSVLIFIFVFVNSVWCLVVWWVWMFSFGVGRLIVVCFRLRFWACFAVDYY